ncbi:MAG: tetratricopeptide repeat protein [Verrucomicrobia bacterium]|nr:tetratricopeptide repeat protein [Verrucomicrobiota bacterium]MDE3098390.1 tetratricopeptide repeat protein [Verrucomicrobiota bacterium]
MLVTKNPTRGAAVLFFALAIVISGCGPPGPRALLKGRKFIQRGDYGRAAAELKAATRLLSTNGVAWNDYGVALQHTRQFDEAAQAYQNALKFDRDLVEAHYNLGCLWMEMGKLGDAKTELTAYIIRRGNEAQGWLELGDAQLRADQLLDAEKSFSTVLYLNSKNPAALNGMGLARLARDRPQDAEQFFAAAVQDDPAYGPAILNLAVVNQEYLRNNDVALENYRAYLALTPRPGDWDAVNALATALEQKDLSRSAGQTEPPPEKLPASEPPPIPAPVVEKHSAAAAAPPAPRRPERRQPGVMHRLNPANWFARPENRRAPPPHPATQARVPAPANSSKPAEPVHIVAPAPPVFPRYMYRSAGQPAPGNRAAASTAFRQAQQFQEQQQWPQAMEAYGKAAAMDPSWFDAQYNYGVLAFDQGRFGNALAADEMALAIQPDSMAARYNFALALQAAGYVTDAVEQFKRVVAENPGHAQAHLALGNIYARQYHDVAAARQQYLKVLALDPGNPHAADIQFWLSSNPP